MIGGPELKQGRPRIYLRAGIRAMSIIVPQFVASDVSINAATGAETPPAAGTAPIADGMGGVAWGAPSGTPYTRAVYRLPASASAALYNGGNINFAWDSVAGQVLFTESLTPHVVVGQYLIAGGGIRYATASSGPYSGPLYLSSLDTVPNAAFNPAGLALPTIWNEFLLTANSPTPLTGPGLTAPSYKVTVFGAALGTAPPGDFINIIIEVMAP